MGKLFDDRKRFTHSPKYVFNKGGIVIRKEFIHQGFSKPMSLWVAFQKDIGRNFGFIADITPASEKNLKKMTKSMERRLGI